MKKWFILFFLVSTLAFTQDSENILYVTNTIARVQKSPSAFSPVKGILKFAVPVKVIEELDYWIYVKSPKGNIGYISKDSLVDLETMKRQILTKDGGEFQGGIKGFSEEDEITAGTKGFSEEEEISAGTKGFSEEDEVTAGTKGFSRDVEDEHKQHHQEYRYDLVDEYEKSGTMLNPRRRLKRFRKMGKLGEFK